ncbi:hypothetical protein A0H81_03931 [Grifola frondosa]|uniref:Fe2OG dioxygenase domain-containing protein n=1 Tax=Grifola frondosa TaxID=5627 RepID=A0A1C7MHV8_GRIFR|nr:hypothetical protein A0H81_03931 [Grifola frondosa]
MCSFKHKVTPLFTTFLRLWPRFWSTTSGVRRTAISGCHFSRRGLATLAEDAKSDPAFRIPLIDFSRFRNATSQVEKHQTAEEIVKGFTEVGFIYLDKHGIPDGTVKQAFQKSAEFFSLPAEIKDELAWNDPRSNRGYVKIGRERVTQSADSNEIAQLRAKAPDFKESMEIGRDWDTTWKNHWPRETDAPEFKQTMLDFFQTCHDLHTLVMRAIALGLGLDEKFFDDKINEQYHNLRLLSYPPIRTSLLRQDGQARAGAHSDYGTLTLLFQDSVGGLEVLNPHTKQYQAAMPIPGTIVVNAGDLLSRWSNDTLRSTLHRVVAPPAKKISETEGITPARQSIAFFCNPNGGAEISCLPNCYGPGKDKKYASREAELGGDSTLQGTYYLSEVCYTIKMALQMSTILSRSTSEVLSHISHLRPTSSMNPLLFTLSVSPLQFAGMSLSAHSLL